ncbi:MAG: hypothetical protein U9N73_01795 [Candidatus Auribacterota bacterium]|nr:hypothetical protein [Candidatus Auribacterota bacterium]
MKITFTDWKISQAPITVLQHLYYYTHQYGISVRQFTGQHWRYWEELPELLREAQDNPENLDKLIRELGKLSAGSKDRILKRRSQIPQKDPGGSINPGKWEEKKGSNLDY